MTRSMEIDVCEVRFEIARYCENNRELIAKEFDEFSNEEYNWSKTYENWLLRVVAVEKDEPDVIELHFDCYPFGDQLRAYVDVDEYGAWTSILIRGE
jgi:hypothetical protein